MINAVYPVLGRQTELPFYISGIGISDPEYNVLRDEGLVSHQFLITAGGEGVLFVGDERFILKENSCFYLAPGVPHRYRPVGDSWVTHWLVFRGRLADELMSNMGFGPFEVETEQSTDRLSSLFELIMHSVKEPIYGGEKSSVLLYEFIAEARRIMLFGVSEGRNKEIADKAIRYINDNFMRDIPLEEIAKISGVSEQHFCRVFKTVTGMRPVEYILNKRISEAKLLLVSTDMKISEIAASVGFNDQNYFGIIFRRSTGLTPTAYRRQGC